MAVITALSILTLTGCENPITAAPPEPQVMSSYSTECNVTAFITPPNGGDNEEFKYSGRLTRRGLGFWELELTSPDTVSGMRITAEDEVITSYSGELTFSLTADKMPDNSSFMAVFESLDALASCDPVLTSGEDGGWVYACEEYTVIFDGKGIPVSMAVSQPSLTVDFSAFENLPAEETV